MSQHAPRRRRSVEPPRPRSTSPPVLAVLLPLLTVGALLLVRPDDAADPTQPADAHRR